MKMTRLVSIGSACVALSLASHAAQSVLKRIHLTPGGAHPNGTVDYNLTTPGRSLSADGRFFAFASFASNLVAGDTNLRNDVFVHDRLLHITRLASVSTTGVLSNANSSDPSVSNDGNLVAFVSQSTTLVPGTSAQFGGIFVRDFASGTTTRENIGPGGVEPNYTCYSPSLSGDGLRLLFVSRASNLVANDTQNTTDVFVRDRVSGALSCISVNLNGQPGSADSDYPTTSNNGRYVVFQSFASDLVPGDTNDRDDLFVRDLSTGVTELITQDVTNPSPWSFGLGTASDDGRYVAFSSSAPSLVFGDWNGVMDVFLRDRLLGVTTLVSANASGQSASGLSWYPVISADGSVVVYASKAADLAPNDDNGQPDVFKWERSSGVTSLVAQNPDGTSGTGLSANPDVSADGRTIAFRSLASDLVAGAAGNYEREYVSEVGALSLIYCTAGTSGNGCVPSIGAIGAPSASGASPFVLRVAGVDGLRTGMIFYSIDNPDLGAVAWGSTTSSLCVKLPVQRTPAQATGGTAGACNGLLEVDWIRFLNANSGALGVPFSPGTTIHAQGWYRDPANAKSSSLSNALAIEMNP